MDDRNPQGDSAGRGAGRGAGHATRTAGVATAIALVASPVALRLSGDPTAYALPLLLGVLALAGRHGMDRRAIGLRLGRGAYSIATLHPLLVVGAVVWLSTLVGATRVGVVGLGTLALQIMSMAALTAIGTLVTEDGFFRGVLWGLLDRDGRSTDAILLWTSGAYALWYLPLMVMDPTLSGSPEALAVHGLNVWLLGMCWGVLRLATGSVLVVAWAHGLWSGLAYTLFGYGPAAGALGVTDALRFDPERGWAGVALNAAAFLVLWRWWRAGRTASPAADQALDGADAT